MTFLLFFSLLLLLLVALVINKGEVLTPWVILCAVYTIGSFIVVLNNQNWEVSLSALTVFVIIVGLVSFGIGALFSKQTILVRNSWKNQNVTKENLNNLRPIQVPLLIILLISLFFSILLFLNFHQAYQLSLLGGNPGGYELMLKYARRAINYHGYSRDGLLNYGNVFCRATSYVLVYIFLYNSIYFKQNLRNYINLIPVIIYIGITILTTGRNELLYLVITSLIIWGLLYRKKNNFDSENNIKLVFRLILVTLMFLFCFYQLGSLTGKSQISSLFDTISRYLGSSIVALDIYLTSPRNLTNTEYFGGETLYGFYRVLKTLGFNTDGFDFNVAREFVYGSFGLTNIYTALRRYINDFGYFGMIVIQFLLGFFYTKWFMRVRRTNSTDKSIIFYATFFYPIVESVVEERFLSNILTTTTIYLVILINVMYYFLVKRTGSNGQIRS